MKKGSLIPLLLVVILIFGYFSLHPPSSVAQTNVRLYTVADLTGDASKHALATDSARWVIIACPSTNSADVRVGDTNVSTTRGYAIPKGTSVTLPTIPTSAGYQFYNLANIYHIAGSNDKVSVTYAK